MTLDGFKKKISIVTEVARLICFAFLAIILGIGAYEAVHERATFESDTRRVSALIGRTEQTVANFKEATDTWKKASKAQADQSISVLRETTNTLAVIRTSVRSTDAQLNIVLKNGAEALTSQNQSLLQTQSELRQNLQQMQAATVQLQSTLADADKVIADPKIQEAIANLADATKNANKSTEHLAGITQDGKDVADYYKKKLTTPASFAKTLFNFVLDAGSKAKILF